MGEDWLPPSLRSAHGERRRTVKDWLPPHKDKAQGTKIKNWIQIEHHRFEFRVSSGKVNLSNLQDLLYNSEDCFQFLLNILR